jgi:hypothetical protein
MSGLRWLEALFAEVVREAQANPSFAERLTAAYTGRHVRTPEGRRARRAAGPFDPFEVYDAQGETALRNQLQTLDLEQLKDIVAEHGMDQAKLAMKWKTSERLVELIIATVSTRVRKGDAFRSQ